MRVICFGDSNTYGYDPRGYWGGRYDAAERWPDILAAQTGWEIVNLGENGRQIPDFAGKLPTADQILVMLGTNDLLQGAAAAEAGSRMELFLNVHMTCCSGIVLICPPPMKRGAWVPSDKLAAESVRLGQEYEALARKKGIRFVDTRDWSIGLAFDGVHFTEEGHRRFAEKLREELCP